MSAKNVQQDVADTAKYGLSLLFFTLFAWLSDVAGGFLFSMQSAALNSILTLPGGIAAAITSLIAVFEAYIFNFGATELIIEIFVGMWGLQFMLALFTLCVFYAVVLSSPKGTYSLIDCLVAAGVFLIESFPFLGGFVGWSAFSVWLRRKAVGRAANKLTQKLPDPIRNIAQQAVSRKTQSKASGVAKNVPQDK